MESEQQFYARFGERLKKVRKERGMTQAELAQKMQTSINSVRLYEAGNRSPSMATLNKMAEVLGVNVTWLFHGDVTEECDEAVSRQFQRREQIISMAKEKNTPLTAAQVIYYGSSDRNLMEAYNLLNAEGQQVAVERVQELAQIPKYQRQTKE